MVIIIVVGKTPDENDSGRSECDEEGVNVDGGFTSQVSSMVAKVASIALFPV